MYRPIAPKSIFACGVKTYASGTLALCQPFGLHRSHIALYLFSFDQLTALGLRPTLFYSKPYSVSIGSKVFLPLVQHSHCLFNKIVDTAVGPTLYIFHDERFKLRTELESYGSSLPDRGYSSPSRSLAITEKSSSVVVSPFTSPVVASSRRRRRMILPLRVFGSA
jgi:hypothetical protein